MALFKLHFFDGTVKEIDAENIAAACHVAGVGEGVYPGLDYYVEADKEVRVFGQAHCGCVYSAEDGTNCFHDMERIGVLERVTDPNGCPNPECECFGSSARVGRSSCSYLPHYCYECCEMY